MFKQVRGGGAGRGASKRPPPNPPTNLQRPGGGRISMGGRGPFGRTRVPSGGPPPAAAAPAREETFSLESGGPLDFAAIIRLTPDLVDEIRRVEAQGGTARIKFDSKLNSQPGNVIDVGGKEFNFSWSKEVGDLCDIYEEQRNGEDGHGLLVECGSAWRKLSVQRILDESTKNHVKMRSEEAERQSKARKAIILDPANPSVKSQAKSMVAAAVEGNMRNGWRHKKEHFQKKQKVEANAGQAKSVLKMGQSSNSNIKGRLSMSLHPSPPDQPAPGTSTSPFGIGSSSRGNTHEDVDSLVNHSKEVTNSSEKENPKVSSGVNHDAFRHTTEAGEKTEDLRSILISILSENPKGMSLKDLEKAVAGTFPNPSKKIESVIKSITTFQAPGKYFLKPGVEVVGLKQASDSRSSPESFDDFLSAIEIHSEKVSDEKFEQQSHSSSRLDESNHFQNIDKVHQDPCADDQRNNNANEDRACSSSESGSASESDSESSDSGSDSGSQSRSKSRSPVGSGSQSRSKSRSPVGSGSQSRSKSRSPVGSGSPSSSDSESDATSSNKEGSDVDVDIMTSDDDKDVSLNKAAIAEEIPTISMASDTCNNEHELNVATKSQELQNTSTPLDSNNFHDLVDHVVETATKFPVHRSNNVPLNPEKEITKRKSTTSEEMLSVSPNQEKHLQNRQMSYGKYSANDVDDRMEKPTLSEKQATQRYGLDGEIHDTKERMSKPKSKRLSTSDYSQEKPGSGKKPKVGDPAQVTPFRKDKDAFFLDNMQDAASIGPKQERSSRNSNISSQENKHETTLVSSDLNRSLRSPGNWNCPIVDADKSGQSNANLNGRKIFDNEKSSRSIENFQGVIKHAEHSSLYHDGFDGYTLENKEMQNKVGIRKDKKQKKYENINAPVKYFPSNVSEGIVDKLSKLPESHHRKYGDFFSKDNGQPSIKCKSDVENSSFDVGKKLVLRREPSELELGEFRESTDGDDSGGVKRQFERKGSFKMENKVVDAENFDLDISKTRTSICAPQEMVKEFPRIKSTKGNRDGHSRKALTDKLTFSALPAESQPRPISQNAQFSRMNFVDSDVSPYLDKPVETAARNETRQRPEMNLENQAVPHKEVSTGVRLHDNKCDGKMVYGSSKESRSTKLTPPRDFAKQSGNGVSLVDDTNESKRRESPDEDISFYVKYDKERPELKGLIKDFLQYKDYVQEYREKYEVYCSLNKNLEEVRNDFLKISHDLERAEGKDVEEYSRIVEKLRVMYHQRREKNEHMKKVFILLHEELKNLKQRIKDFADSYLNE